MDVSFLDRFFMELISVSIKTVVLTIGYFIFKYIFAKIGLKINLNNKFRKYFNNKFKMSFYEKYLKDGKIIFYVVGIYLFSSFTTVFLLNVL